MLRFPFIKPNPCNSYMFRSLIARFYSSSSSSTPKTGLIEFFQQNAATHSLPLYDAEKKEPIGRYQGVKNYSFVISLPRPRLEGFRVEVEIV